MKRLVWLLLVGLLATSAKAQNFITPDQAFSGTLLDGVIDTSHSTGNTYMWQTINSDATESVAIMEEVHLSATNNTQQELDNVRNGSLSTGGTLQADENGSFNGFLGKQFTIRVVNSNNADITYTVRAWASRTGETIYAIVVYEMTNNLPAYQGRMDWFLNSATLPK